MHEKVLDCFLGHMKWCAIVLELMGGDSHLIWSAENGSLECTIVYRMMSISKTWLHIWRWERSRDPRDRQPLHTRHNCMSTTQEIKRKEVLWYVWMLTCIFHVFEMEVFLTSFIVCCIYLPSIQLTFLFVF